MNTIVLVGYRGTGKTTRGRWLAATRGWSFIDTDAFVLKSLGMDSVKAVWQTKGEQAWRAAEASVIPPLLIQQKTVISLGGGAPVIPVIAQAIREMEIVVHLWADPSCITARLQAENDRPALSEGDLEMMASRLPLYREIATCAIDTSGSLEATKDALIGQFNPGSI